MFRLTPDVREQLRAQAPDGLVFHHAGAPGEDFVFRPAGLAQFDAFMAAINGDDGTAKVYAHRSLALDCVVFPTRDQLRDFARERPGVVHALGNELAKRSGINAEIVTEGL